MSSLAPCATSGGPSGAGERRERVAHDRVTEEVAVEVDDIGHSAVVTVRPGDTESRDRAVAGRARPARRERHLRALGGGVQCLRRTLRVARDCDVDVEGAAHFNLRRRGSDRVEDAREQRAELELVEQHAHLFGVERALLELGRCDVERDLAVQHRHLAVLEHPVPELAEILTLLRRKLVEMLEDPFEVAVGGDELGGGLLTDARHARQVVAGVAPQRRVLRVLLRGDPTAALDDPRFVVEGVLGHAALVVEHFDVRVAHELVGVAVAGDDDHVDAGGAGLGRERRDHVVGFDAGDLELGDLQRVEHLVDERQLRAEQVGGRLAAGLVFRIELDPVGAAARRVERDRDVVGLLVAPAPS